MKRNYLIILLLLLATGIFAQTEKEVNIKVENNEIQSRFANRKERGFYNIMQVNFLFGNSQAVNRTPNITYPATLIILLQLFLHIIPVFETLWQLHLRSPFQVSYV
jgi:hypothetical protein